MSEHRTGTPKDPPGTLAERIFIVPSAHSRVGDVSFQVEMYELFHRTPGGRIGHILGTPTVLFGALMLLSRAPGPAAPISMGALILGMAAWGTAVDRLAGAVTAVLGVALTVAAAAAGRALGASVASVAAALILGGCGVQTFSHLFEDVPPPQSGTSEFLPLRTWLGRAGAVELLRSTVLTFAVFYWLELWASLRILPIQVLHLLMRAGHRPDLRRALDARVAEILAAPGGDWRRPRAKGALR
jgi:hypothetical protein